MCTGHIVRPGRQNGSALFMSLIFVALFACMAVALAVASDTNLAISRNRVEMHQASNLSESGLLLTQMQVGGLQVVGTDAAALHASLADHFRNAWASAAMIPADAITADATGVSFPDITVSGPGGRTGTIRLFMQADGGVEDGATVAVRSTGLFGEATRTAHYDLRVRPGHSLLRDYGVVSRSPILMTGGARVEGANNDDEGSLFSSSASGPYAIYLEGQSAITGDACASANVIETDPNTTVGGDVVEDAPDPVWPEVDISKFRPYAENVVAESVDSDVTISNILIPAGTNPTFSGNVNIYGVVYIESPNRVTFAGNTNFCGIVVAEEPAAENFEANQINFTGNMTATGVEFLPEDPCYDGLRDKTGTFLLTPGYQTQFDGAFATIHGYMMAGKFRFAGGADATVRGGVVNLSDSSFSVEGNSRLRIDKKNAPAQPVGLDPYYSLVCISGSYRE